MDRRSLLKAVGGIVAGLVGWPQKSAGDISGRLRYMAVEETFGTPQTQPFFLKHHRMNSHRDEPVPDVRDLTGVIDAPWRNPIDVLVDLLRDGGLTDDEIDLGSFAYARGKAEVAREAYALTGCTLWENIDICADAAGGVIGWFRGKMVFFCERRRQNPAVVGA